MTLLDEIKAKCSPELLASRDYDLIAETVSASRKAVVKSLHGIGSVIEVLGLEDGPSVLNSLDQLRSVNQAVKWGWILLEKGELDFGSDTTRLMIDSLVLSSVLTAEQSSLLKSLAERDNPVSEFEIRKALWSDEGVYLA